MLLRPAYVMLAYDRSPPPGTSPAIDLPSLGRRVDEPAVVNLAGPGLVVEFALQVLGTAKRTASRFLQAGIVGRQARTSRRASMKMVRCSDTGRAGCSIPVPCASVERVIAATCPRSRPIASTGGIFWLALMVMRSYRPLGVGLLERQDRRLTSSTSRGNCLGQSTFRGDEALRGRRGPWSRRGSPGATCPDRNRAVTTSAVTPGSRPVDHPPLASCRGRKNAIPRSVNVEAEAAPVAGWAGSCNKFPRTGMPAQAINPRVCAVWPTNRRREVFSAIVNDPLSVWSNDPLTWVRPGAFVQPISIRGEHAASL